MADAQLVEVAGLKRYFDVSPPFLNRAIEGTGRRIVRAVDGVGFSIARGETFALVGESGCGKSTVARTIVGLHAPTAGAIRYDGREIAARDAGPDVTALRRRMQMIFQDPYASLNPRWRVRDIVGEPIRHNRLLADRAAVEERVAELLVRVGPVPCRRRKIPARILRRSASADLDRARARGRARIRGLRRADLGARRLGPGPDPQPDEGASARARPDLSCSSRTTSRWSTTSRRGSR